MFALLAATFDPQHDLLHELYCLQPSVARIEKCVWVATSRVCCIFEWENKNKTTGHIGVKNHLRVH